MQTNGQRTISLSRLRAMDAACRTMDGCGSATKWICVGRPPARKPAQALRTIGSTRATARTMPSEGNGEKTEKEVGSRMRSCA